MTDLTITPADVALVSVIEQATGPAGEDIDAGEYCRLDTTSGKWVLGNGSEAAEARLGGIALNSAAAGLAVTVVRSGVVDVGEALAALTFDDDVYLSDTDGKLADAAGTVGVYVGTVVPGWGNTTADKLLRVQPHAVDLVAS